MESTHQDTRRQLAILLAWRTMMKKAKDCIPQQNACFEMDYSPKVESAAVFVTEAQHHGMRVDLFLAPCFPTLSKTKLRLLFAAGAASVNGVPVTAGHRLHLGDRISLQWSPQSLPPVLPEAIPLSVLHEDEHLIAIQKPSGILMHPTRSVKRGTLTNALLWHWNPKLQHAGTKGISSPVMWPRFIHRLDRHTSGIVLAAKSASVAAHLGRQFASRQVSKQYLAILSAVPAEQQFTVEAPVGRVREETPQWDVDPAGAPAQSLVRILQVADGRALALLSPVTGRTNQLRIHTAHCGVPIVGDAAYGGAPAARLCLHAWRLALYHPDTGQPIRFEAPVPEEMQSEWPAPFPPLPSFAEPVTP